MKTPPYIPLALVAMAVAFGGWTAEAAVIAQYDFENSANRALPSTTGANSTVSQFGVNGGTLGTTVGFSGTGNVYMRSTALTTTESGAVTAGDYLTFTVTPNTGYEFDLTSLTLLFGGSTSTGPFTVNGYLRSSLDNFATDLSLTGATYTPSGSEITYTTATADLSSLANIVHATGITFRLYVTSSIGSNDVYNDTANGAIFRADNVTLNGSIVAVPEPANLHLAWVGVGAGLLVLRFRRRCRSAA
jgi:hypothetical protein